MRQENSNNNVALIAIYWITNNSEIHIPVKCISNIYQDSHFLGHKICLNTFKMIQITQSMFFDHNEIKLEINNRKITEKSSNIWKLNRIIPE